ncbi:MAG: ABC transporter permease [Chloroflexi bacterium]|nr:ABC transporter permease [Chloroflexota bacterium]
MKRYLVRRLIGLLPTLFLISILVFSITRVLPGDPAAMLAASDEGVIDPELRAFITKKYGLDDPLVTQYFRWIWGVVRGDWGDSFFSGVGVFEQIRTRAGFTIQLAVLAWVTGLLIGIPLGVASALRRNSIGDMAATSFAVAGIALPHFWLGMLMIILFAVMFGWLPSGGYTPIGENPASWARGMVMPTIALGTALSAGIMRLTRSALLEVLAQDYVRTARAKGLGEPRVIWMHALRNALLPVVTLSTLQLGGLIGGTVVTETVFFLPGVGRFVVDAVIQKDYLIVQMGLMFLTLGVVVANLIADVAYTVLDPRIRYE